MYHKQYDLFQDPQNIYPIYNLGLSFADYISQSRQIIANSLKDKPNANLILDANSPFELRPEQPIFSKQSPTKIKYGALLIHGLLDTPFMMRDVGRDLQSQGLLVRSIVLPGHATVPGELLNIKYEEWLQALRYGIASLKNEVDQIFLVGFSTGATLSVFHSLIDATQIAGIIMLSPAYKINSNWDFVSGWTRYIDWAWKRAQWMSIAHEIDYAKYLSAPFNSIYQVYRLAKELEKIDHTVQPPCPIWIGLSEDDLIVDSRVTIDCFKGYTNPKNKMLLYSKKPRSINDARILVKSSAYPDLNIVSFSHTCVPISPLNPHYGKNGDYPLASHVDKKNHYIYGSLDKPTSLYHNFMYKVGLSKYEYQRLTFNPDFDFMMGEINRFIRDC